MAIATTYKWTLDRYHQAVGAGIFDDQTIELLRGDLVVMPPEREPHAYYNSEIGDYLRTVLGDRAKVREAHPVTLPDDSEPIPDLAIVEPLGSVYRSRHPHPADIFWLVEISNTTLDRDLTVKRDIYAAASVLEYWVVNLPERSLVCFRDWAGGGYATVETFREGVVSPRAFPELELSVRRCVDP